MKIVLIIFKNLGLGVLGVAIMGILAAQVDSSLLFDYLSAFGWAVYISCKIMLELD